MAKAGSPTVTDRLSNKNADSETWANESYGIAMTKYDSI